MQKGVSNVAETMKILFFIKNKKYEPVVQSLYKTEQKRTTRFPKSLPQISYLKN